MREWRRLMRDLTSGEIHRDAIDRQAGLGLGADQIDGEDPVGDRDYQVAESVEILAQSMIGGSVTGDASDRSLDRLAVGSRFHRLNRSVAAVTRDDIGDLHGLPVERHFASEALVDVSVS